MGIKQARKGSRLGILRGGLACILYSMLEKLLKRKFKGESLREKV